VSEPIPLAQPDLGERERELVLEALSSGRVSLGPKVELFERSFAARLGAADAVAASSGTAALHLGVRALGWGEGDEVITSPFTFVATANALVYERATPVFCDIDPVTLNLDPAAVEAAVGESTAGALPRRGAWWEAGGTPPPSPSMPTSR
jgi:perosamine synthetase